MNNKRTLIRQLSTLVFSVGVFFSYPIHAVTQVDGIAAVVDDDVVLKSELQQRMSQVYANFQQSGNALPPADELKRGVLNQLILESIQLQRSQRMGVNVSDEQLNSAMANIARSQGISFDAFRQQLLNDGSYYPLQEQIRKDISIKQLQNASLARRVNISPEEIDAFLSSPEGKALAKVRYQLGHILVPLSSDASNSERQKANEIIETARTEISTGKDPERWAKVYNVRHGTQVQGGFLGWRTQEELPSLFANVAPQMAIGDISSVLEAGNGLHIIQLIDSSGKAQLVTQSKARHILIKTSAILNEEQAELKATELRTKALNGESFSTLAKQNSDDIGTAQEGGDLGWSRPGAFVPLFEQTMEKTNVGDISLPFKTQFGWHIIQVEDRKDTDMREDVIKNQAYNIIRERKFDDVREEWLQQLRNNAYVNIK